MVREEMAEFELYVKGQKVRTNKFVTGVFREVMLALLRALDDVEMESVNKISVE
jgi:hypothetical protein